MHNLILLFLITLLGACSQGDAHLPTDNSNQAYLDSVALLRKQKHVEFKVSKKSPFYKRKDFRELDYYPASSSFRFWVKINRIESPELVQFATSGTRKPVYQKVAYLVFSMNNDETDTLWGFVQSNHPQILFVPFKDLTNNTETYGGGRYLELDYAESMDSIYLDFNMAFNPYCHYDTGYSCPVVPFYNHLNKKILAGEKRYPYEK